MYDPPAVIHLATEIVLGLVIGSGMGAILLALGERARRLLRLPVPPGLRPAAAFVLGSGAFGLAVLGAGLVGGFRPLPLFVLTALAAAAGRWRALPRLVRRLLGPGAVALPLLPVALAPPFFYDSWVYHLGLPWQALQDHSLLAHTGNLFSTFPPLAQLIYAVPLAAGATRATGWIHLIGYLTASAAVASVARRLGASRPAAFLAGAAVLYLPTAMLVPALPAAEAWAVSAVTVAVGLALAGRPIHAGAVGAGLAAGVACAARLQGVPWAVLVALILAVRSTGLATRRSAWLAPRVLGTFGLAVAAGAAPWWAKNALLLGDPFAPIGWHRAGIETLWRDASSHINLAAGPADLLARAAGSLGITELLVLPLLVVGLVAFWMERRTATLLVLGTGAAGWIAWSLTGALGRLLTPSLALLVGAAAAGRRGAGRALSVAVLGGVLGWGAWEAWTMSSEIGGWSVAGEARAVYAAMVVSDPSPAFRACGTLPPDARLLLVCEPRGFLLPRAFETTSQHDPTALAAALERNASAAGAVDEMRGLGFTHLLINVSEMRRLGATYPVLPWSTPEGQRRFVELTRLLGKPVVLEGDVVVYALSGGAPEPPFHGSPGRSGRISR